MKISGLFLLTSLLLHIGCIHISAKDKATLRYQLRKGEIYNYDMTAKAEMTQNMMGQEMRINSDIASSFAVNVMDATPKEYTLDMVYNKMELGVKGLADMGMPDTTFAIKQPERFHQTAAVTPQGKILRITMPDSLPPEFDQIMRSGGAGIRNAFKQLMTQFPDGEIAKGHTWAIDMNDTSGLGAGTMTTQMHMIMKFEDIVDTLGKQCARVSFSSDKMKIEGSMKQMEMDISVDGDGKTSGKTYYDLKTGVAIFSHSLSDMDMHLGVTGQQNMIMTMSTSTDMTTKLNTQKKQ